MSYKIIMDSCGELPEGWRQDPCIESVPLTLDVGGESILDDETFDQKSFLKKVADCPVGAKSACPSPERYMQAYDCGADHIYAVTLSAELSGSYNSAVLGKNLFEEEHPDAKVHVFNSCSASIGETLIAMKVRELEEEGLSFEEIVSRTEEYIKTQHTFFVLENLDTLKKNGRLKGVKALAATVLKIKPVMGSTDQGTIQQIEQVRGINKAIQRMAEHVAVSAQNTEERILAISHCNCPERAVALRDYILSRIQVKKVVILDTAGVSTVYANDGGVIVVL